MFLCAKRPHFGAVRRGRCKKNERRRLRLESPPLQDLGRFGDQKQDRRHGVSPAGAPLSRPHAGVGYFFCFINFTYRFIEEKDPMCPVICRTDGQMSAPDGSSLPVADSITRPPTGAAPSNIHFF